MTKMEKMRITMGVAEATENALHAAFLNYIHNHDWDGETLWGNDNGGNRYDYEYIVSRLTADGLQVKRVFDALADTLVDTLIATL